MYITPGTSASIYYCSTLIGQLQQFLIPSPFKNICLSVQSLKIRIFFKKSVHVRE